MPVYQPTKHRRTKFPPHAAQSLPPSQQDQHNVQDEHLHHRQGESFHTGSGELHEEAVGLSISALANSVERADRYPEALSADFDNTGCGYTTLPRKAKKKKAFDNAN